MYLYFSHQKFIPFVGGSVNLERQKPLELRTCNEGVWKKKSLKPTIKSLCLGEGGKPPTF